MTALARKIVIDTATTEFATDVVAGLTATPKRLLPKYFYDGAGSALFEQITELPEYYPTRREIGILEEHAGDIAALIPPGAALVEFGSGSSTKTRKVLSTAASLAAYVPVDISAQFLQQQAAELRREYPKLAVLPVAADFTRPFELPDAVRIMPRVGFFPGSTIGNFDPARAVDLLRSFRATLGTGARLVIGMDLCKAPSLLEAAYDDAAGVTAAFNRNLLNRINRELGGTIPVDAFEHRAAWNDLLGRIEMHLVASRAVRFEAAGEQFSLQRGETIHTENSYKYTPEEARLLARAAGWEPMAMWNDPDGLFSLHVWAAATDVLQP